MTINTFDQLPSQTIVASKFVVEKGSPSQEWSEFIAHHQMIKHKEGGYFVETDRSPFTMEVAEGTRNYSTLIYYLLTPDAPTGKLHRNVNRIIHILQKGRGQYVLIYPDGRVHSFKVGFNYAEGEVSQWVVPGGVFKGSFLLEGEGDGLLISEVVVPGFEYQDHAFMSEDELRILTNEETVEKLKFLLP